MIELVFIVCLVGASADCRTVTPDYGREYPHVVACMREGTMRAAQWQQSHPDWTIRRWRCEDRSI
ncbi:hypothetical protein [Caenispirillum bisanense]|uniref:hypothetical protein n=1 Tax=Caenispirillum bisanense TaxID=414052 RepID=UPI0031D846B9